MKKVQLNAYLPFILCTLVLQTAYASSQISDHIAELQQDENASATKKLQKHNRSTHNHSNPLSEVSVNTSGLKSETSTSIRSPEPSIAFNEYTWERNIHELEKN